MKLLIVTSIVEHKKEICEIFKNSKIHTYSTFPIDGHKLQVPNEMMDNWFSYGRETIDSKLYFTFASDAEIETVMEKLDAFNKEKKPVNPIQGIVIPIEKHLN